MLTYSKALELKNAGFPFRKSKSLHAIYFKKDGTLTSYHYGDKTTEEIYLYVPTLSELVEACGKKFWALEVVGKKWRARAFNSRKVTNMSDKSFEGLDSIGSSPEEAVASLYLALHK